MVSKAFFVLRYLWMKVRWAGTIRTEGFVFLERDVTLRFARSAQIHFGRRVYVKKGAILECGGGGRLSVGAETVVGYYAWLASTEAVEIGAKTLIGNFATIFDVNHRIVRETAILDSGYLPGNTVVGEDCLIGTKATVGGNVRLGKGCVVAANSVVNTNWADYAVVSGAPARLVRER